MNAAAQSVMTPAGPGARWPRILVLVGRLALAGVFLLAAYSKMKPQVAIPWSMNSIETSLSLFAMQVDSYQMLSPAQVLRVAHLLPPFELLLGLWLLSGVAVRFSTLTATAVLTGFFSLMVRTYALGLSINCGCFGPGEQLGVKTLLRDGSLLAVSLAVTFGAYWVHRLRTRRGIAAASRPASAEIASQESR
jgi:uncharacterized membrane protein YphA (DoxX/SURF4 family)